MSIYIPPVSIVIFFKLIIVLIEKLLGTYSALDE